MVGLGGSPSGGCSSHVVGVGDALGPHVHVRGRPARGEAADNDQAVVHQVLGGQTVEMDDDLSDATYPVDGRSAHTAEPDIGVDSGYESRLAIVERMPQDADPRTRGWRHGSPELGDPDYEWWERVLKEGPDSQILEQLVLAPGEPAPRGTGWKRTESTGWLQRELRKPSENGGLRRR